MDAVAARPWRERMTVGVAAAATLAVIAAPGLAAGLAPDRVGGVPGPDEPAAMLSAGAERALAELPHAYQVGRAVVVPAATDPRVRWDGAISADRVVGHALPLGVRGIAEYPTVASTLGPDDWTDDLTAADGVFSDVGPLFFACTRWPGESACSPALLVQQQGGFYFHRSGLGSGDFLEPGAPMEVLVFDVIGASGRERLVLGGLGGTAVDSVRLELGRRSAVSAWVSTDFAVAGATVWWATVPEAPVRVLALDAAGDVVADTGPAG